MSSKRSLPLALCPLLVPSLALLGVLILAAPPCADAAGGSGYVISSGSSRDDFQYAFVMRGRELSCALNGRNTGKAIAKLEDEVDRTGREVLYVAIGDREYVIRDSSTIARAGEIVEPMNRLGKEQGRLGSMQGELGRKQGELGSLQGQVGQVEGQWARLEARDDDSHRADLDELRQQLRELSAQVRAISERQRTLGEQQRELGERQRELGQQQARASRLAFSQLRELAEKAIASGKAESLASD
jgi:predicted nuclease with TOPRIM domain